MLYCSSECGSISIMQLRTIYCNTYVRTFHVCLCLLALTFVCNSTYLLKLEVQRHDSKQYDAPKALSHGAIFLQLATLFYSCLLVDVKLANTRFHHSLLIDS